MITEERGRDNEQIRPDPLAEGFFPRHSSESPVPVCPCSASVPGLSGRAGPQRGTRFRRGGLPDSPGIHVRRWPALLVYAYGTFFLLLVSLIQYGALPGF